MLGFRGASRYYDPRFREAFALECRALARVRERMGLSNVKLMVPFCRTVEEGRRVLEEMAAHGLRRGENGLEVYVMCEIPANVVLAEEFAERLRRLLHRQQRPHAARAGGGPRLGAGGGRSSTSATPR
jgi:pyruvate, water dikinase